MSGWTLRWTSELGGTKCPPFSQRVQPLRPSCSACLAIGETAVFPSAKRLGTSKGSAPPQNGNLPPPPPPNFAQSISPNWSKHFASHQTGPNPKRSQSRISGGPNSHRMLWKRAFLFLLTTVLRRFLLILRVSLLP